MYITETCDVAESITRRWNLHTHAVCASEGSWLRHAWLTLSPLLEPGWTINYRSWQCLNTCCILCLNQEHKLYFSCRGYEPTCACHFAFTAATLPYSHTRPIAAVQPRETPKAVCLFSVLFFINMCWYKIAPTCHDANTHSKYPPFGPRSCQSNNCEGKKKKSNKI